MMRKIWRDERGAALIVEAVILYPIVFLCVFFLIFIGLFFIQNSMLEACAQKVAIVTAKEVAYPGFLDVTGMEAYSDGAVELKRLSKEYDNASAITVEFDTGAVDAQAYRYWSSDPLSAYAKGRIVEIITEASKKGLVYSQSLIGKKNIEAKVSCTNHVIAQYVKVEITQEVMDIGVLKYFGISNPTIKATAMAAVNDTDELARNADFVKYAINWLLKKIGIDLSSLRKTVTNALGKIGIKF